MTITIQVDTPPNGSCGGATPNGYIVETAPDITAPIDSTLQSFSTLHTINLGILPFDHYSGFYLFGSVAGVLQCSYGLVSDSFTVVYGGTFSNGVYSEPASTPPNYSVNEVSELLNGSSTAQRKIGTLLIGERNGKLSSCTTTDSSGCSKLCLNPNLTAYPGASDPSVSPPYCIKSWSELTGSPLIGAFVNKRADPTHSAASPDTIDNGAFSIQAPAYTLQATCGANCINNPNAQLISLITEAPSASGLISGKKPTGLIAEAKNGSAFAAQFFGAFSVVSDEISGIPHQICLNSGSNNCITSWSDLAVVQDPTIVRLQNVSSSGSLSADVGSTAATGRLVTDVITIGAPVSTTPFSVSCGDGICTSPNESASAGAQYCPSDCQ